MHKHDAVWTNKNGVNMTPNGYVFTHSSSGEFDSVTFGPQMNETETFSDSRADDDDSITQTKNESNISKGNNASKKKTTGPIHNQKYKAKMCKNWVKTGACPYYEKCQFAHGAYEIEKWANHRMRSNSSQDLQESTDEQKEHDDFRKSNPALYHSESTGSIDTKSMYKRADTDRASANDIDTEPSALSYPSTNNVRIPRFEEPSKFLSFTNGHYYQHHNTTEHELNKTFSGMSCETLDASDNEASFNKHSSPFSEGLFSGSFLPSLHSLEAEDGHFQGSIHGRSSFSLMPTKNEPIVSQQNNGVTGFRDHYSTTHHEGIWGDHQQPRVDNNILNNPGNGYFFS